MTRRSRSQTRRIAILSGATVVVVATAVVALLMSDTALKGVSGTMGAASAPALEVSDLSGAWDLNARVGRIDMAYEATFELENVTTVDMDESVALYFSRDDAFSTGEDCLIEQRAVSVPAGGRASARIKTSAHLVDCVDAGTWNAAIHVARTGQWIALDQPIAIENGEGHASLVDAPSDLAFGGALQVNVNVLRPPGPYGTLGLRDWPVDLWLAKDDVLCVLPATRASLPRNAVRAQADSWTADPLSFSVETRSARRVRAAGGDDPFAEGTSCTECGDVQTSGSCPLSEGEWLVAAGPAEPSFVAAKTVFMHAPPVRFDTSTIEVTVPAGETAEIRVSVTNPSARAVTWEGAADDRSDRDWLVAQKDETLGSGRGSITFTVSAEDLTPGFYSGVLVLKAGDFYGTEARIPVDLQVERSEDASLEQPSGDFVLENYPNPFRGRTTVAFEMPEGGNVRIAVFDLSGREVRLLVDGYYVAGRHDVPFDADGLPSGTYLYRLTSGAGAVSKTMTVVR